MKVIFLCSILPVNELNTVVSQMGNLTHAHLEGAFLSSAIDTLA